MGQRRRGRGTIGALHDLAAEIYYKRHPGRLVGTADYMIGHANACIPQDFRRGIRHR